MYLQVWKELLAMTEAIFQVTEILRLTILTINLLYIKVAVKGDIAFKTERNQSWIILLLSLCSGREGKKLPFRALTVHATPPVVPYFAISQ